jgi:hypothetical protein
MMPRHERRRLEEIENWLRVDDPEFASGFADASVGKTFTGRWSPQTVLGSVAAGSAGLSLVLGEGSAFFVAAVLAAVLIGLRHWTIATD